MDRKLFVCQCENINHSFCTTKDDDGSVLFEIHLSKFSFITSNVPLIHSLYFSLG